MESNNQELSEFYVLDEQRFLDLEEKYSKNLIDLQDIEDILFNEEKWGTDDELIDLCLKRKDILNNMDDIVEETDNLLILNEGCL